MSMWRNTIELIRFRKKIFFSFFFFNLVFFLSPLASSLLISEIFNQLQDVPTIEIKVMNLAYLLPLTYVVQIVGFVFFVFFNVSFLMKTETLLRKNLMEGILELPGAQALTDTTGEAISRFRGDVTTVSDTVFFVGRIINFGVFAVIALALMFTTNARVTSLILIPFIILIIAVFLSKKKITKLNKASRRATGRVTSFINEIFISVRAIKVSNAEQDIKDNFATHNHERKNASVKDELLLQVIRSMYGIVASISIGLMAYLIIDEIRAGNFSIGDIFLFTYFIGWLTGFVGLLGELMALVQKSKVSYGRLAKLAELSSRKLVKHGEIYIKKDFPPLLPIPDTKPLELLEIKNLQYTYPDSKNGIHDISFSVPKGSFTVITGRIGCGKTTLLRAIQGLLWAKGEICWNGELVGDPTSFFKPPYSSYTPQIPTLFSDTIENNLNMGMPIDITKLHEAVRLAVIDEDIQQFQDKFKTIVGPKGVKLSGGQKQRLAAARMFSRKSELFILDDISSALDINTEQILWKRVFKNTGSSYIITSHRKAVLKQADQIVLLKNGQVDDIGTLDELLLRSKEMQNLWETELTHSK